MRKRDKLALGCTVVLAVALGVAVVLVATGWGTAVKNVVILGVKGGELSGLARRTPFSAPPSACLGEGQLTAYLEVCRRVKTLGDRVDAWETGHRQALAGRRQVSKVGAAGLVGDYLRELRAALEDAGMGPAEFAWIAGRVEPPGNPVSPAAGPCAQPEQALLARHARRIEATRLGEHARRIAFGFANQ